MLLSPSNVMVFLVFPCRFILLLLLPQALAYILLDFREFASLAATGYSAGDGLGMGVSPLADCLAKFKRTEGGVTVCADGNAEDNWDTPPAGGWGFYDNGEVSVLILFCLSRCSGFGDAVSCPSNAFCPKSGSY
eukprot:753936-Hanusia_phi.AAC.7